MKTCELRTDRFPYSKGFSSDSNFRNQEWALAEALKSETSPKENLCEAMNRWLPSSLVVAVGEATSSNSRCRMLWTMVTKEVPSRVKIIRCCSPTSSRRVPRIYKEIRSNLRCR